MSCSPKSLDNDTHSVTGSQHSVTVITQADGTTLEIDNSMQPPPKPTARPPPRRKASTSALRKVGADEMDIEDGKGRAHWQSLVTEIAPLHQLQDGLYNQIVAQEVSNAECQKHTKFMIEKVLPILKIADKWGTITKKTFRNEMANFAPVPLRPSTVVDPSPIFVYNDDVLTVARVFPAAGEKIAIVIPTGKAHEDSVNRWFKGQYKAVEQEVMARTTLAAVYGVSAETSVFPISQDEVLVSTVTLFASNTLELIDYDDLLDVTVISVPVSKRLDVGIPLETKEKTGLRRLYNNAIRAAFEEGIRTVILSPLGVGHHNHSAADVAALLGEILLSPDEKYNWAARKMRFIIAVREFNHGFKPDNPWEVFKRRFFGCPGVLVDVDGEALLKLVEAAALKWG